MVKKMWDEEEKEMLRNMVDRGLEIGEIMEILGRTYNSVDSKISVMGLRNRSGSGKEDRISYSRYQEIMRKARVVDI